jgi:hypothetical protein
MKDAMKTRKLTPRPKIFVVKTIHHHVAMVTYKYRLVAVYTPRVQTLRYVNTLTQVMVVSKTFYRLHFSLRNVIPRTLPVTSRSITNPELFNGFLRNLTQAGGGGVSDVSFHCNFGQNRTIMMEIMRIFCASRRTTAWKKIFLKRVV